MTATLMRGPINSGQGAHCADTVTSSRTSADSSRWADRSLTSAPCPRFLFISHIKTLSPQDNCSPDLFSCCTAFPFLTSLRPREKKLAFQAHISNSRWLTRHGRDGKRAHKRTSVNIQVLPIFKKRIKRKRSESPGEETNLFIIKRCLVLLW